MASLTVGYKIWDSTYFLNCSCNDSGDSGTPGDVVYCGGVDWLPRGAQLQPKINCDTGTTTWFLNDYLNEYPVVDGARNGIAVTNPNTGEVTLWDVSGLANSGAGDTVSDKLLNFLQICNCQDCDSPVEVLEGEYECDYPDVPNTGYCYDVTVTNSGNANALRIIAMKYNAYMVGYPIQTAHNLTTLATVYRICLDRPIAQIGNPSTEAWVLVP